MIDKKGKTNGLPNTDKTDPSVCPPTVNVLITKYIAENIKNLNLSKFKKNYMMFFFF